MTSLHAAARTTDPNGRDWEIYAFRIKLPERGSIEPGLDGIAAGGWSIYALSGVLDGLLWLLGQVVLLLVRVLVDIPMAAIRALGSDEWTIEAVSWAPPKTTRTWTTTREHRGQVLAQIEGGLARGESPRPRNAQFIREI